MLIYKILIVCMRVMFNIYFFQNISILHVYVLSSADLKDSPKDLSTKIRSIKKIFLQIKIIEIFISIVRFV